jgi:AraC-like DNA-binding protein/quercetin dioxygenase-like cupin family protein
MNVENLPILQAREFGFVIDPGRPVLSFEWSAEGPHRVSGHRHPRGQIIYQTRGVYRVTTSLDNWVVPRLQAIWIPPDLHHETFTSDSASALMLFVDGAHTGLLPPQCMVVSASPLLRELFTRVVHNGNDYPAGGRAARLIGVMLDELGALQPEPMHLPLARDKRLRRVMDLLLANPADERTLEELASECAASSRTLERLFSRQTGMTFFEWRKRLRLHEAIDRLGQGQSVTRVALALGYSSPSAFIAMFRRSQGVCPGQYRNV